jgi:hypothetical protein
MLVTLHALAGSMLQQDRKLSAKEPTHLRGIRDIAEGCNGIPACMIRKLKSGEYRLYSRKKNASTGKRRNLGTFSTLEKARQHERAVQYFKRH